MSVYANKLIDIIFYHQLKINIKNISYFYETWGRFVFKEPIITLCS